MDAIILAAGRGERLRPLTDSTPKPLLEIAELSLIEIHLYNLAHAGFTRAIINLHHLGHLIREKVGDGARYGLAVRYSVEKNYALETAGGIIKALPLIRNNQFAVISADVLCDFPLAKLQGSLNKSIKAHLVMVNNPQHHPDGDFSLTDSAMVSVSPRDQRYTFSGIAYFSKSLFNGWAQGRRALRPVLERAIIKHQLSGEHYTGLWSDVGTVERLESARQSTDFRQYIDSIKQSIS